MTILLDKRLELKSIPEKGRGFVATSFIPQYTRILEEKPYKVYKSFDKLVSNIEIDLKKYKLRDKFNNLYPNNLDNNKNYYLEKICKNAFNFNRKTYSNPCILFDGALFNHSCDPNVLFINCDDRMIFYTIKDVYKGDELMDHYIDVNLPVNERLLLLYDNYGFICKCNRCMNKCSKKILNYYNHHNKIIK